MGSWSGQGHGRRVQLIGWSGWSGLLGTKSSGRAQHFRVSGTARADIIGSAWRQVLVEATKAQLLGRSHLFASVGCSLRTSEREVRAIAQSTDGRLLVGLSPVSVVVLWLLIGTSR